MIGLQPGADVALAMDVAATEFYDAEKQVYAIDGKQLDAAQIAAVTHYERHAWSNNVGDITQPRDVIEFTSSQE